MLHDVSIGRVRIQFYHSLNDAKRIGSVFGPTVVKLPSERRVGLGHMRVGRGLLIELIIDETD
jgi:hypothetical protein